MKIIYALIVMLCAAVSMAAQSKQPRTVEDFYMALPAKYIQPLAKSKDRRKLIKTLDVANGYLYLSGETAMPEWEGWAEMALFKKTTGAYLVGVVDGSCATMCYSGVIFLEYKNGKWTDVTKTVIPKITDKMTLDRYKQIHPDSDEYNAQNPPFINYELPQRGTTVKVNANEAGADNTLLFELAWNGAKFELKK